MKALKTISKVILGIALVIYLLCVIAGFIYTWKAGLSYLIALFFLLMGFASLFCKQKEQSKKCPPPIGIVFFVIVSIILFIVGGYYLSKEAPKMDMYSNPSKNETRANLDTLTAKETDSSIDLKELVEFQKNWADSILKLEQSSENDNILSSVKLSLPDTILFEYSEDITKYGFDNNFSQDTAMFREWYFASLELLDNQKFSAYPVYISCVPNQKVVAQIDTSIEWEHPALAFQGMRVYEGNEFHKEYIGYVDCVIIDPERSSTDMHQKKVLIKGKNKNTKILYNNFRKKLWTLKNENDFTKSEKECF